MNQTVGRRIRAALDILNTVGNKRRLRWIAGAFGAVVALFIAVAFYLDYNSTDAKIERAVAQIVEEYGFESVSYTHLTLPTTPYV